MTPENQIDADSVWHSVRIECEPGDEEIVSTILFASGFSGIEEAESGDRIVLTAFLPSETPLPITLETVTDEIHALSERAGTDVAQILSVADIPFTDWEVEWRKGLAPVEIGTRFIVRPSWTEYNNSDNRIEIIIDPKMAFGTGGHATTILCMEMMEQLDISGKTILDAGCGSGVLSIAAVKLGAAQAYGFDHDHFSVENARENIYNNGVIDVVTIDQSSLESASTGRHDIVFANMISGVLIPNITRFPSFLKSGGCIVFSGILAEEEAAFRDVCGSAGLLVEQVSHRDEWIAVLAVSAD